MKKCYILDGQEQMAIEFAQPSSPDIAAEMAAY